MEFVHIGTISDFYKGSNLGKPKHPLIGMYSFQNLPHTSVPKNIKVTLGYYVITLKKNVLANGNTVKALTIMMKV